MSDPDDDVFPRGGVDDEAVTDRSPTGRVMRDRPVEAPDADAAEQAAAVDGPTPLPEFRIPFEANEADAFEQSQVIDSDDEYR